MNSKWIREIVPDDLQTPSCKDGIAGRENVQIHADVEDAVSDSSVPEDLQKSEMEFG